METSLLIGTGDFLAAGFGEACFTGLAEDAFFDVFLEADLDGFGEGEAFFVSIFFETALGDGTGFASGAFSALEDLLATGDGAFFCAFATTGAGLAMVFDFGASTTAIGFGVLEEALGTGASTFLGTAFLGASFLIDFFTTLSFFTDSFLIDGLGVAAFAGETYLFTDTGFAGEGDCCFFAETCLAGDGDFVCFFTEDARGAGETDLRADGSFFGDT